MTILSVYIDLLLVMDIPNFLPMAFVVFIVTLFFVVLAFNRVIIRRVRQRMKKSQTTIAMMNKAVEISANNVVRYKLSDRRIYNLYGQVVPEEGLDIENWKKRIHPDDLDKTLDGFFHILDGRSKHMEMHYRWNKSDDVDKPEWAYIRNFSVPEYMPGTLRISNIISTLEDETSLLQEEQKVNELTRKYKIIFENSIIGLSFYTPDGWLLDSNKMMRDICNFDSEEYDAFFSETNLFDQSPFRECCDKNNLEDSWFCTESVVPERDLHEYLEIRVHPIFDDNGKVSYIAVAARNVTEERQMYLQAKLNDIEIQKANEKIKAYEEELTFMMEVCEMHAWRSSFETNTISFLKGLSTVEREISFKDLEEYFLDDKESVHLHFARPSDYYVQPMVYMGRIRSLFKENGEVLWVQINSVPIYDDKGTLTGAFGLIRNISGLMKKQEQLKSETERANDSGRQKSVFLANMTHEIRTPLNAIVGFSDLLQAIDSPDDKKEMIRVIHNNCDMLLRLINDILVLSNADANAMEIIPEDIDFARKFEDLCQSLAQRIQEPTVQFLTDITCKKLLTCLDNARLDQVLTNFVTNAVKYTHQGHIRVGYRIQERNGRQGIYAYCEDTGTGIPHDQKDRIFERFVKLNDYIQGTGLGLSICKVIVEKCGGEIGVESEVGKGSTFWYWVPADIQEYEEINRDTKAS
ncbi:MAG: PAS domain-containing protein [Prevotella sp.]|nr:PAS domain-containing protein [Prevotella sp.]